jgi:isoleucyl-tRNA synthetase
MVVVRNIASIALAERAKAGIKVRQKLGALHINKKDFKRIKGLEELIKEEVNVQEILVANNLGENEVKLDTNITPALEREGVFREIIRAANDLRKESSLTPDDTINLFLNIKKPGGEKETFSDLGEVLKKETRAKNILFESEPHEALSAERGWKERSWELWVGIKKI